MWAAGRQGSAGKQPALFLEIDYSEPALSRSMDDSGKQGSQFVEDPGAVAVEDSHDARFLQRRAERDERVLDQELQAHRAGPAGVRGIDAGEGREAERRRIFRITAIDPEEIGFDEIVEPLFRGERPAIRPQARSLCVEAVVKMGGLDPPEGFHQSVGSRLREQLNVHRCKWVSKNSTGSRTGVNNCSILPITMRFRIAKESSSRRGGVGGYER